MSRRTKAAIQVLKRSLYEIIGEIGPMTVRQVFYQAVSRGLIDKTEAEYKQTIGRLLTQMRKDGDLPWHWLADNTRWMRKPDTFDSLTHMLNDSQKLYRRALWNDQDAYVEIWLEKDALTEEQIISLDLQTRPTKKTEARGKNFGGESVEVDAIHPDTLRQMVETCITHHINQRVLTKTRLIEQRERETLGTLIQGLNT